MNGGNRDGQEDDVEIDRADVKAEVEAAFARYEEALVGNDVATLEALFHDDPRTIRYGVNENLYGMDAIRAFRRARPAIDLARRLDRTVITTYGRDLATASTLFHRDSMEGSRIGRQMQTWIRLPEGWRIVAAHVSVVSSGASPLPEPSPAAIGTALRGV